MTSTATKRNFNRFDGRERDAGFAPKSDARITKSAATDKQRFIREATRNPVTQLRSEKVLNANGEFDPVLPKEFVAQVIAKLQIHIGRGHWEQAKACLDDAEREWSLVKIERDPGTATMAEKLAWHVARVFDHRTANLIEGACSGTIGGLLECFPSAFINSPNCGPATIRKIAEHLLSIGMIDAAEAQRRIDLFHKPSTCDDAAKAAKSPHAGG